VTAAPIRATLAAAALVWPVALIWPMAALGQGTPEATARYGPIEAETLLRVQGTTDVPVFDPVLRAFVAARPGLGLVYEQWASNDLAAAARAACDGATPAADVLVSSAVDQLAKYVNDGCAQAHRSAATAALPADRNWRDELFGVTREPAVIVYNRDRVPAAEAPATRFDLLDLLRPEGGRYAGKVATYDIEASGLGYLFAFADSQQATTFGSLIEAFGRSGATATCCSDEIIDGVAEGRWLIAYNVLGSYALARAARDPRIAVVAPADYTLVLSRGAVIPRDAPDAETAGEFVDFLLSDAGRRALAEAHLLGPDADGAEASGQGGSTDRPIALSPTLLLGLDAAKRAGFLAFWRAAFPPPH
jgi:ABC-type Fe3+ transport system substrate-binding protein